MTKLDMVRDAVRTLGEATPTELSAYIRQRYAAHIPPPVVALMGATLRDDELMERLLREAREVIAKTPASVA